MKILLISPSFPPAREGEAEHAFQLAERLASRGHNVDVLTNVRQEVRHCEAFSVDASATRWGWRNLPWLLLRAHRAQADAVLLIYTAWLFDDHPMITFLASYLRWFQPSTSLVVVAETDLPPSDRSLSARIGRKAAEWLAGPAQVDYGFGTLLSLPDRVVALGPTILDRLAERCTSLRDRAVIMPPPPLIAASEPLDNKLRQGLRKTLGAADETLVLAFFGYVYPGKGVETLFTALKWLLGIGIDARIVMLGGGRNDQGVGGRHAEYERTMKAFASTSQVAERVVWQKGYHSGSIDISQLLQAADLAVLPFDDGVELRRSTVAVVASVGLPLVTTSPRNGDLAFVDGSNAVLVPPRDPASLGAAIARVAGDPVLRARLRQGSLDLVEKFYSWRDAVSGIEAALVRPAPVG